MSNEGDVMHPHFFALGLSVYAAEYKEVLEGVVRPWIESGSKGEPYTYQHDSIWHLIRPERSKYRWISIFTIMLP